MFWPSKVLTAVVGASVILAFMEKQKCPRCGGWIPSNENPGAHVGALSRSDNVTEICSLCGVEEALLVFGAQGVVLEQWPVVSDRAR